MVKKKTGFYLVLTHGIGEGVFSTKDKDGYNKRPKSLYENIKHG